VNSAGELLADMAGYLEESFTPACSAKYVYEKIRKRRDRTINNLSEFSFRGIASEPEILYSI
jgi:hypothetical protein